MVFLHFTYIHPYTRHMHNITCNIMIVEREAKYVEFESVRNVFFLNLKFSLQAFGIKKISIILQTLYWNVIESCCLGNLNIYTYNIHVYSVVVRTVSKIVLIHFNRCL